MAVGQKAKVANTNETSRQHVEEESPQELFDRHRDQTLLVFVSRIPPTKNDLALGQSNQPVIGYGNAVGVSPQIAKNMFRATEGALRIHHPVVAEKLPEPGREDLGLSQQLQGSMKTELAFAEGALQSLDELAPKDPAQYLDGKKKGTAGLDPAAVIRGQTSRGQHAMDMGMMLEFLVPGVQDAEETDLGAEMPGVTGYLEESFSAGSEQQVIDDLLILQSQRRQFPWHGDDHMHVGGGQ